MTSKNICEFCDKEFVSKTNLNIHIKTSKKCILNRGEAVVYNYKCENCNKVFTIKSNLISHLKNCKVKDIVELKEENEKYLEEINKLKVENQSYLEQIKNLKLNIIRFILKVLKINKSMK